MSQFPSGFRYSLVRRKEGPQISHYNLRTWGREFMNESQRRFDKVGGLLLCILFTMPLFAQASAPDSSAVPHLVRYSGTVKDSSGKPVTGLVHLTISLYSVEEGGESLWSETQNVQPDARGNYSIYLGATEAEGLPLNVFVSGEARWLGIQAEGQPERPRVLLLSVPYALKAGDAATIGGLPPSAFVLANPAPSTTQAAAPPSTTPSTGSSAPSGSLPATTNVTTSGGKVNFLPLWDATSDIVSSVLSQSTTGGVSQISVGGTFALPNNGTATATAGKKSRPLTLTASAFNSGTSLAVPQKFQWQAEPTGNDTATPAGTLNLLFASGTNTAAETGFSIDNTGLLHFVPTQTFPGTGTITGVTAGAGLTGGGTSGNVGVSVVSGGITNDLLQNSGLTVSPGTDLTGGGLVSLGGSTTLNLDTTKVPQLATNNTFAGVQVFNSNVGIGTSPNPVFALQTIGTIRSETGGLSLGGNAPLSVDAPGIARGHFAVLSNGNVGINNPNPTNTLDVHGGGSFTAPVAFASNQTFPGTAQLNANNSFTGNQTVNGNLSVSGITSFGTVYVESAPVTIPPKSTGTAIVICPAGQNAISGGFDFNTPGNAGRVVTASWTASKDRWRVDAVNDGQNLNLSLIATAICANVQIAD
jgi:hypothetical protein